MLKTGAMYAMYVVCVCFQVVNKVRGKLSSLERKTLSALIVIDVHARDVVASLARDQVASTTDFAWISQLRCVIYMPSGLFWRTKLKGFPPQGRGGFWLEQQERWLDCILCHRICFWFCRYQLDGDQVVVKMINATINYGYEYLGNSSRLVSD